MTEWKKVKLSEIGEIVGGATPSTKDPNNYDGNISWITPKDLASYNERFIKKGERSITKKGFESCSTKMLPKNSILFSSRAPIGYVAIADNELCTNQGFKSFIPGEKVDYLFMYYLLKNNKTYIESLGSGTTFKEVSGNVMKNVEVLIPTDILIQKKISSILGSIDDRIEVNNKINNNLLEQSLAFFEYMFIDSDYPSKQLPLYDFAEYINGAAFKPDELEEAGLPVIKISELKSGITDSTKYFNGTKDEKYLVSNGDILFSWSGNPETSIDVFLWSDGNGILNQHIFNVKSKFGCPCFTYLLLKHHKPIFTKTASNKQTTGLGHVTVGDLKRLTFPFNLERMTNFEENIRPFMELFYSHLLEIHRLRDIRDTLLPKLMSGEVDVSSIEL